MLKPPSSCRIVVTAEPNSDFQIVLGPNRNNYKINGLRITPSHISSGCVVRVIGSSFPSLHIRTRTHFVNQVRIIPSCGNKIMSLVLLIGRILVCGSSRYRIGALVKFTPGLSPVTPTCCKFNAKRYIFGQLRYKTFKRLFGHVSMYTFVFSLPTLAYPVQALPFPRGAGVTTSATAQVPCILVVCHPMPLAINTVFHNSFRVPTGLLQFSPYRPSYCLLC